MPEDVIVTLTLNPSIDHSVTVEQWRKNRTNRPLHFRRDPGGKGLNVSRVIHRLGGRTLACGLAGGSTGQLLRAAMDREGVPTELTEVEGETRINTIITDLSDGSQTRLNLPGPHVTDEELEALYLRLDAITSPGAFVAGGSLPEGVPPEVYENLLASFIGRGVPTYFDADGDPLRYGIRAKPHLIKPNEFEVAELLGERLRDLEEFVDAAKELAGRAADIVVISLGEQGAVAADSNRVLRVRAPHVEPLSAVGAGDSMLGAMVLALSRGEDLPEALRWGAAAGAAAVLTPGTELCRPEDVHRLLPQVRVDPIA